MVVIVRLILTLTLTHKGPIHHVGVSNAFFNLIIKGGCLPSLGAC